MIQEPIGQQNHLVACLKPEVSKEAIDHENRSRRIYRMGSGFQAIVREESTSKGFCRKVLPLTSNLVWREPWAISPSLAIATTSISCAFVYHRAEGVY
jgi:hypothetical protein